MTARSYCLLALSLCCFSQAEKHRLHMTIQGLDLGYNTYEIHPDGTFESDTTLNIGSSKIVSHLTGTLNGGTLTEFSMQQNMPTSKLDIHMAGKKVSATVNGKSVANKLDVQPFDLAYANYHPVTMILAQKKVGEGTKEYQIYLCDNGKPIKVKATRLTPLQRKSASYPRLRLELNGLKIDYIFDEKGEVIGEEVPIQKFHAADTAIPTLFEDPVAKYTELSQPNYDVKIVEKELVTLHDGVKLAHTLWMPAKPGKYPTILVRTPYGRQMAVAGEWYAKRGYVAMAQDVRGREDSSGTFDPFVNETKDAKETLDWISAQAWSDGKVGMIGGSYLGYVQWAAAKTFHPALKCIIPQVSPPDVTENIPYEFGTFFLFGNLWWGRIVENKMTNMGSATHPFEHAEKMSSLPLSKLDKEVMGHTMPLWQNWLKREDAASWKGLDTIRNVGDTSLPAFHISGWWDGDEIGTNLNWARRRAAGHTDQWLIYGPWVHNFNTTEKLGDVTYGSHAILELDSEYLRFFDTYLKGKDVNWQNTPRVRAFITGINKWRKMSDWPAPEDKDGAMYLSGSDPKKLSLTASATASSKITYAYDPLKDHIVGDEYKKEMSMSDATMTIKPNPKDKSVLYYQTPKLEKTLAVGGPITLDLFYKTDAKDTDFYAFLADEDEKGVMRVVSQFGKYRASAANSTGHKLPIKPGATYKASLRIWDTGHAFLPGHKMTLVVLSSIFPRMDRNLGTGESIANATKAVVQTKTILCDPAHPSVLHFKELDLSKGLQ